MVEMKIWKRTKYFVHRKEIEVISEKIIIELMKKNDWYN